MTTRHTAAVIIGAGPAGLATSRCLTDRAVDHVVVERGRVAESWRTQRWDSLRMLTPNWMNRLPGEHDSGDDPDRYLSAAGLVVRLDGYQQHIDAPVVEHTTVTGVRQASTGLAVETDAGSWHANAVVVATGAAQTPHIPALAESLPADLDQLHALSYRNPGQLRPGAVLVVGASASGVQIADELQRTGHSVTIAVGDHVRLPRTYRDRDIYWWMHTIGLLDERDNAIVDLPRARRLPSAQLIGTNERRTLDLNHLHAGGVQITGKLAGINGGRAQFSGALANLTASADLKLRPAPHTHRSAHRRSRPHRHRPTRPPDAHRPRPSRHRDPARSVRHGDLGHRLPHPPPLHRPGAARPARPRPPPRRRHRDARPLCARPPRHPAPQLRAHRRHRRRRQRAHRPPSRTPRRQTERGVTNSAIATGRR